MNTGRQDVVVVVGFSSAPSPLEPAWPSTHRALLPVAGKALIVHLIEQLERDGLHHVRIAGSIQQYAVRQRLGDGREWGVTIRYSDLHGADLRLQTLLEFGRVLYLCGDNLHTGNFAALHSCNAAFTDDPLARSETPALWELLPHGPGRCGLAAATSGSYSRAPLMTAASYHTANLAAAAGEAAQLLLPGYAIKAGAFVDWDTHIGRGAQLGKHIVIGKHCHIGRRVRLAANCVIGNGVVIGPGSHLRNVCILPNTYVGARTQLRDAVITPLGLFGLDGAFLPSPDATVIGRTRRNAERRTGIPSEKLSLLERAL